MSDSWQLLVNKLDGSIETYTFNTNNHERACIVQNSTLIYLDNNKKLFDAKNYYNFQQHPLSDPFETIMYTADEKLATTTLIDTCRVDGTLLACADYCHAHPTHNLCYDSTRCYEMPNDVTCEQVMPGSKECSCPPTPAPTKPQMCRNVLNDEFSCLIGSPPRDWPPTAGSPPDPSANACCGWEPSVGPPKPNYINRCNPTDGTVCRFENRDMNTCKTVNELTVHADCCSIEDQEDCDECVNKHCPTPEPPLPVDQKCYNNTTNYCCKQSHGSDNKVYTLKNEEPRCDDGYELQR